MNFPQHPMNGFILIDSTYQDGLRNGLSLQQPSASAWTQSYGYDAARRLTGVTSPAGTFGYTYNVAQASSPASLIRKLSLPGGSYVTNAYDSVARLLSTELLNNQPSTSTATATMRATNGRSRCSLRAILLTTPTIQLVS